MPATPTPGQNRFLAALSDEVQRSLFHRLELVPLPLGKVIYESGGPVRYVFFPTDAIVSLLYVMQNGASAEVALVGNDGVVGISAILAQAESTPARAVVQRPGYAYRLTGHAFASECNRSSELLTLTLRYTQCLITQMAQTAACNRHHSIDHQLCRWLLLCLDRSPDNCLTMTQEQIAYALGVRREGISDAAGRLQKLGVIEYSRGHIAVLDRNRLEALTCECYAVVRRESDRLLRAPMGRFALMPSTGSTS